MTASLERDWKMSLLGVLKNARYRSFVSLVLIVAALSAIGCNKPPVKLRHEAALSKIHTVAVMPFVDAPGEKAKGSGKVMVNAIISRLYEFPEIRVVERGRIDALLAESDLSLTGFVDQNSAAQLGKMAGADAVIVGELMQYEAQQNYGSVGLGYGQIKGSTGATSYTHRVGVSLRLVNVANGRIVYSKSGTGVDRDGFSEAAEDAVGRALDKLGRFYQQTRGELD